jgi:site-specific DNA-methyltransferase (adenine-specific)
MIAFVTRPRSRGATKARNKPAARSSTNGKPKYQFFPDLPPDEFAALMADIDEHGIQVAVIQDELGNTIDGHQRERAAKELGIVKYPITVMSGLTEEQKRHLALSLNVKRRHLTRPQMQALIEQELLRTPDIANNWLAEILGVDDRTVQAARKRLESTSALRKFTKLRGKDGKHRAASYGRIVTNTPAELRIAQKVAKNLPPSCNGKMIDAVSASRHARRFARAEVREGQPVRQLAMDSIRIFHCPFQKLRETAGLRPKSVNLILTDIPYGKDFLPQLDDLGRFAAEVLVAGGLFITFVGQFHLDRYFESFGKHLTYRWTIASTWERDANLIYPLGISSRWKPILLFSKGPYRRTTGRKTDLLLMPHKEKGLHEWQQPVGSIEELIKNFSNPGDLIVDPCAGSFTTAIGCHSLSRRFVGCDSDGDCVRRGQERLAGTFSGKRKK